MTDPRRPDDERLSTADLASASDRLVERDVTREAQQAHANVVADSSARQARTDDDPSTRSSPATKRTTSAIDGPTFKLRSSTSRGRQWRTPTGSSRRP
jgi:hypothetical protein